MIKLLCNLEIKKNFFNKKNWIILGIYQLILGFLLRWLYIEYVEKLNHTFIDSVPLQGMTEEIIHPFYAWMVILLLFIIPFISMNTISLERKNHTLPFLCAHIPSHRIILGKFLSLCLVLLPYLFAGGLMPLILLFNAPLDLGHVLASISGVFLLIFASAGVGLLFSCLVAEPWIAGAITLLIFMGLSIIEWIMPFFKKLSWLYHLKNFLNGMVTTPDVIYFLSLTLGCLLLAQLAIQKFYFIEKNKTYVAMGFNKILLSLLISCNLVNYFFTCELDLTYYQFNSLRQEEVALLQKIKSPLEFCIYSPSDKKLEESTITVKPFLKAKPDILVTEIHALFTPTVPNAIPFDALVVKYDAHQYVIPLAELEREKIIHALYNLLYSKENWVAFLTGHGEPDIIENNPASFSNLTRHLKNYNHQVTQLNLQKTTLKEVPSNTNLLIIADPQSPPLAKEITLIKNYIMRGGNLLWLIGHHQKSSAWQFLLNDLGIKVSPEVIVDPHGSTLGTARPEICLVTEYLKTSMLNSLKQLTVFPFAKTLSYKKKNNWNTHPLLVTHQETYLKDRMPTQQGPFNIGLLLQRDKQQVVVIGNSHFLTNALLNNYGNLSLGLTLIEALTRHSENYPKALHTKIDLAFHRSWLSKFFIEIAYLYLIPALFVSCGLLIQHRRSRSI